MSWNSYIDNLIGQSSGSCDKVGIIGIEGGGSWTTGDSSSALVLQGDEGANIAKCFKKKDFTPFQSGGVHVAGIKYQFLREEDGLVLAKKKDQGSLTMQASKTAIVMAHCPEGQQQGNLNKAVGNMAEYLTSLGY